MVLHQFSGRCLRRATVVASLIAAYFFVSPTAADECNLPLLIEASVGPEGIVKIELPVLIASAEHLGDADPYVAPMHRIHHVPTIADARNLAIDLYLAEGSADRVPMMVGGVDRSWAAPVSGDWSDALNWNPVGVPELSDNVTIRGNSDFSVDLSTNGLSKCVAIGNDVGGGETRLAVSGSLQSAFRIEVNAGGHLNLLGGLVQTARTSIHAGGLVSGFGDLRSRVLNDGVVRAGGGELVVGGPFENGPGGAVACDDQATLRFGDGDGIDKVTTRGGDLILPRPANAQEVSATYAFSSNAPVDTSGGSILMESLFFSAMLNGIFYGHVSTGGGDVRFSTMCEFGSCDEGETLEFHGGLETMGGDLSFDVTEDFSLEPVRFILTKPVNLGGGALSFRYEDTKALVRITDDLTAGSFEISGDVFEAGDATLLLGDDSDDRISIAGPMRIFSGFVPTIGQAQVQAGSLNVQVAEIVGGTFARGGLYVSSDSFLLFFSQGSDMIIGGSVNQFGGRLDISLDALGSDITLAGDNTLNGFWTVFGGGPDVGPPGSIFRVPGSITAHDGGQFIAPSKFPVEIIDTGSIELASGLFEAENVNFTGGGVLHVGSNAILEVCNVTFDVDLRIDGTVMTSVGCPVSTSTARMGVSGAENIIELPGSKFVVKKQHVRREGLATATVITR